MLYFIDSANDVEITTALSLGVAGITANPSMYLKNHIIISDFLTRYHNRGDILLTGEVMSRTYDDMLAEAEQILKIYPDIIIKVCFSIEGLRLCNTLHQRGIKTAMTLIFRLSQAIAAINAHVDYIFYFIGRNEEQGYEALQQIEKLQHIIKDKRYPVKVVAASIKNLYQLEALAALHIDYAAMPYNLLLQSLQHPLTQQGYLNFEEDWLNSIK